MPIYPRLCLLGLIALGGCATTPPSRPPPSTPLQRAFLQSSQEIAQSLRVLQEVSNAEYVRGTTRSQMLQERINADHLTPGLDKPISLDWHGEAEPALKLICRLTRFGPLRVYGLRPQGGTVVLVHANARPAYDVIRNIGAQLGDRGEIRVVPDGAGGHGVLELFYHGAPKS